MNGKEAIIEKIRSDARRKANSTLEEGARRAQETIAVATNDARIYKDKNMAESYVEHDEIIRRRETVANLEVKKLLLQAKKEVIDRAFDEAIVAIKNDRKRYLELIARMLTYAENGDVVIVSSFDKEIVTKEWILSEGKKLKKELVFGDYRDDFCGGIVLQGKGVDKNLTLENELNVVRTEHETEIAGILFGA